LLLVLLWIWAGLVFVVLDLFLNVPEFDRVRPRAPVYRGLRVAAHRMVGEPYDDGEERMAVAGGLEVAALHRVALQERDAVAARRALRELARRGLAGDGRGLLDFLEHERLGVRQEAVVALGHSGGACAVPELARLVTADDRAVRALAIQSLGQAGGEDAARCIGGVLASPASSRLERLVARCLLSQAQRRD
jgi:hypothetical protein